MAKWSVALFGHVKPNYSMIEIEHDTLVATFVQQPTYMKNLPVSGFSGWLDDQVEFPDHVYRLHQWVGNERRALPGHIIDVKPHPAIWGEHERKHFLIVTLDGLGENQLSGITEPEWDLGSYLLFEEQTYDEWYNAMWLNTLTKAEPEKAQKLLNANKDTWYAEYKENNIGLFEYPAKLWRKRRFMISENDLAGLGVDLEQMKDKEVEYVPDITVPLDACYDKLRKRYVQGSDSMLSIQPRTLDEMQNPKTVEETLVELRS